MKLTLLITMTVETDDALPAHVAVEDLSDGCGAKLKITIVSAKFEGLPLLKQHRLVNDAAKDELSAVHAFNLKTFTPAKWAAAAGK